MTEMTPVTNIMDVKKDVNITSAEFKANPFPFYAWLRAEAPVYRVELPDKRPAWLIARYDEVAAALKDERFAKDRRNAMTGEQLAKQEWMPGFLKPIERNMLSSDAPDHTRLRGLVHKAFTPRLLEEMRERIETITSDLLDAAERKGSIELIHDFALPLPVTVIADILGVPEEDRHKFHRWSRAMIAASASSNLGRAARDSESLGVPALHPAVGAVAAGAPAGRPDQRPDSGERGGRSTERR